MDVSAWIDAWVADHCARCRSCRLPRPASEEGVVFFRGIARAFSARGITREAATAASERLQAEPASGAKHVPELLRFAAEAMRATGAEVAPTHADDTRESAEAASRDCRHCGGTIGLVPVYRDGHVPPSVSAICVCRLAAWIRSSWSRHSPEILRRTPELADVLAGRSTWSIDPAGLPDGVEALLRTCSVAELIREWTRRAREAPAKPSPPPAPAHRQPPPPSVVRGDRILTTEFNHPHEDCA